VAERRPVRAIVLDFNGTLAQDDHVVAPLYVDTFASVGVPLTVEQYHRELSALPDRDVFELALARAGLPEHFPVVVSIDDVANGKPDPEGFVRAIAGLDEALRFDPPLEPSETVAIEDATGGARAARAAGMRVVAIRGLGYDPASGYADVIIDRLEPAALEAILGIGGAKERG